LINLFASGKMDDQQELSPGAKWMINKNYPQELATRGSLSKFKDFTEETSF